MSNAERVGFVDAAILDWTESCCQQLQLWTGRTNVWLAVQLTNLSIIVYFMWAAAFFVGADAIVRTVIGIFCGGLLYLLTQTIFKVSVEAAEQSAYRRVASGIRNPRRVRDSLLRVLFLMLCVVLLTPVLVVYVALHLWVAVLTYSLIVLTTVLLYVVACDPLPPCAGRIREWLGALRSDRSATAPKAVAPAPSERRLR